MTVHAFIPARGGSTRIKSKNLAEVGGVSLLSRAIASAQVASVAWGGGGMDYRPTVSTNHEGMAHLAKALGADIHERPADLAGPESQIEDAIAHWLETIETEPEDVIVLLQPTSPFRKASTVFACVEGARLNGSCWTVTADHRHRAIIDEPTEDNPEPWCEWRDTQWRTASDRVRSQDATTAAEDGCVYAFTRRHFDVHRNRIHPFGGRVVVVDWLESLEIDTPSDLAAANLLASLADGGDCE